MSERRKVEVDIDIDTMEETARELGYRTERNICVSGFNGRVMDKCDLVVANGKYTENVGFKKENGKINIIYDNWKGHAEEQLRELMPHYKAKLAIKKLHIVGFKRVSRMETGREIIIRAVR